MVKARDSFLLAISVALVIYSIYLLYNYFSPNHYVTSKVDGKLYLVKKSKNSQESADSLALINFNVKLLLTNMKETPEFQKNIRLLKNRYREGSLMENAYNSGTSFTVNKGERMEMCVATRDSAEKVYDLNLLMFVTIHELSHVGCEEIGHGEEFQAFFKYLLGEAIKYGIYKHTDYAKKPVEYCGLKISGSPI
jgi:hypothetical protein